MISVVVLVVISTLYNVSAFSVRGRPFRAILPSKLSMGNVDDFGGPTPSKSPDDKKKVEQTVTDLNLEETFETFDAAEEETGDDEVAKKPSASPERQTEISSDMKERLRREIQSQGGDPNVKGANPILVISAIIGVLVIAGGKDILF